MAKTATMTIRLDPKVKNAAEDIYASYGMSLTEAINVFLFKSLYVKGLPFDLRPSDETIEALNEVKEMKRHPERYTGYSNVHQMIKDVLAEEDEQA